MTAELPEVEGNKTTEIPRNKILVVCSAEIENKVSIISSLFNTNVDSGCSILKNLSWQNKYYKTDIDVYIDDYDSLDEWAREFQQSEYNDLREVLAGVILLFNYRSEQTFSRFLDIINSTSQNDEKFYIACNVSSKIDAEEWESLSDNYIAHGLELINWEESGKNPFGDKLGLERIREIIDTHEWTQCELDVKEQPTIGVGSLLRDESAEFTLEEVLEKLNEARSRYQSMNNKDEAETFAQEISEELTKYF